MQQHVLKVAKAWKTTNSEISCPDCPATTDTKFVDLSPLLAGLKRKHLTLAALCSLPVIPSYCAVLQEIGNPAYVHPIIRLLCFSCRLICLAFLFPTSTPERCHRPETAEKTGMTEAAAVLTIHTAASETMKTHQLIAATGALPQHHLSSLETMRPGATKPSPPGIVPSPRDGQVHPNLIKVPARRTTVATAGRMMQTAIQTMTPGTNTTST